MTIINNWNLEPISALLGAFIGMLIGLILGIFWEFYLKTKNELKSK